MFSLDWISSDEQGYIPGGEYPRAESAELHVLNFAEELLSQCATDEEREGILDGSIAIVASVSGALWSCTKVREIML